MVVFFIFQILYCVLYAALLELLVVRVLCVLFLNIYFFNMLSTCQQKQNRQKKRQCLKIVDFFRG